MKIKNIIWFLSLFVISCADTDNNYSNLDELRDTTDNEIQVETIYTSANHEKQDSCLRSRYKYTTNGDTILIRRELRIYELEADETYWDREDRLLRNFQTNKHITTDTSYYWAEPDEQNFIPQEYLLATENRAEKIIYKFEIKAVQRLSVVVLDSFANAYAKDIDNFLNKKPLIHSTLKLENKETGDPNEILLAGENQIKGKSPMFVLISYSRFAKSADM